MQMTARINHPIDAARALAPDERSVVVLALLESLGDNRVSVSEAWADEIRKRKNDLRSGTEKSVAYPAAHAQPNAL